MRKFVAGILLGCCWGGLMGQTTVWNTKNWEARISGQGNLEQIVFKKKGGNDTVPFFKGNQNVGPSFYAVVDGKTFTASWVPDGYRSYRATVGDVECRLTYKDWKGQPALGFCGGPLPEGEAGMQRRYARDARFAELWQPASGIV